MTYLDPLLNRANLVGSAIITLLSYIFGEHWILFVGFLLLNVGDYISGCIASKLTNTISSTKGLKGILKKLGYWLMICCAFGMSVIFMEIGDVINVNLRCSVAIGWFVLAALIMNEFRSILENFVRAGYNVPRVLVKGLEVADKMIDDAVDPEGGLDDDTKADLERGIKLIDRLNGFEETENPEGGDPE